MSRVDVPKRGSAAAANATKTRQAGSLRPKRELCATTATKSIVCSFYPADQSDSFSARSLLMIVLLNASKNGGAAASNATQTRPAVEGSAAERPVWRK